METISFEKNVVDIYEEIALEFNDTRYTQMTGVTDFLDSLNSNDKVLDIGCGNGISMLYRKDLNMFGIDICQNFVNICVNKNLNVKKGNILDIEYNNNEFDAIICTSVIHHLLDEKSRIKAIEEIIRVLKVGKLAQIQVWDYSKLINSDKFVKLTDYDYIVKWKLNQERYYHLFTIDEIKNLISQVNSCKLVSLEKLRNNYSIILKKIE